MAELGLIVYIIISLLIFGILYGITQYPTKRTMFGFVAVSVAWPIVVIGLMGFVVYDLFTRKKCF